MILITGIESPLGEFVINSLKEAGYNFLYGVTDSSGKAKNSDLIKVISYNELNTFFEENEKEIEFFIHVEVVSNLEEKFNHLQLVLQLNQHFQVPLIQLMILEFEVGASISKHQDFIYQWTGYIKDKKKTPFYFSWFLFANEILSKEIITNNHGSNLSESNNTASSLFASFLVKSMEQRDKEGYYILQTKTDTDLEEEHSYQRDFYSEILETPNFEVSTINILEY